MFSLIITIISIALVAALALATLYYGGTAFNKGSDGATAARLINEGQQVNGAITIFRADVAAAGGTVPTVDHDDDGGAVTAEVPVNTVDHLAMTSPAYLTQAPATFVGQTIPAAGGAMRGATAVTAKVCAEINARAKHASTPVAPATPGVYGCDNANSFYFKM